MTDAGRIGMFSEYVSIGLSVRDYLFLCEPPSSGPHRLATDHLVQGGGVAATAAVAIARLGGRVELWSRLGDDPGGQFILDELRAEGVDTSRLVVCAGGRSPACHVTVDRRTGEREFIYFPGIGLEADSGRLDLARVERAQAILVDGHWPQAQLPAARRAHERGVPVCGDIGGGISPEIAELIGWVDYPIYSALCARAYGGGDSAEANLRKLAELGGAVPMVTLGREGCIWLERGRVRRLPAFDVEVVDTTGCGDVFHGAFTFALGKGWEIERTARFASAVAAIKCRALGGRTGIPTYEEVSEFLSCR